MKKIKRIIAGTACAALMSGSLAVPAYADNDIRIIVNDKILDLDGGEAQIIGSGTTMVPFRSILEALDMDVSYRINNEFFKVWAISEKNDIRLDMFIGENKLYVSKSSVYDSAPGDEDKLLDPAVATVIELEEAPFIDQNDRTLIPARAISEALGAYVEWLPERRTVKISYGDLAAREKYPHTDIPTYEYSVGAKLISETEEADSVLYEYSCTRETSKRYANALTEAGLRLIQNDSDTYLLESPTNKYVQINIMSDITTVVSVLTNPKTYIVSTPSEVPDYTYCTGRECWDSDYDKNGNHRYFYGKNDKELNKYFDALSAAGFTVERKVEFTDTVHHLYRKTDAAGQTMVDVGVSSDLVLVCMYEVY